MLLQTLALTLLSAATSTTAIPALRPRGLPGAVYICTGENWTGSCQWLPPNSDCHIKGEPGPAAIGPDELGFCSLFDNDSCSGDAIRTLTYPGLSSSLPEFRSLQCGKITIVNGDDWRPYVHGSDAQTKDDAEEEVGGVRGQ